MSTHGVTYLFGIDYEILQNENFKVLFDIQNFQKRECQNWVRLFIFSFFFIYILKLERSDSGISHREIRNFLRREITQI